MTNKSYLQQENSHC